MPLLRLDAASASIQGQLRLPFFLAVSKRMNKTPSLPTVATPRGGASGLGSGPSSAPLRLVGLCVVMALAACGKQGAELGEGGSMVSGSAGPAGAKNAAKQLVKCDAPVATLAL